MEDEIARLRQALEEERRRREAAESQASEEQRRREEEQRRREEAEKIAKPLQLEPYLEACHALSLAIKVVTDRSLTTQGDTTNPAGRVYPRRILPWVDFPARQEDIWNRLFDPSFASQQTFPSQHQLDYVQSLITPISSEHGLRYYERDTVENAVQKLVDAVYENPVLRANVGLRGTVTFESHTNLGTINGSLSEPSESAPLSGGSAGEAALAPPAVDRKRRRVATGKGKGNRADQFCIYRISDGANVPATAIEYKAPHKLSQDELVTGLVSEIQPERDVINRDGDDFAFAAKVLATAVVTQLFSYMVGKGIQYGYVCTGQVFVFLHIPDDPTIVYYYVCVPNQDVLDDDENRLHRTAVAQVFAFIVQALRASPPPMSWHDAAASLDVWAVEYDDVLGRIPPSVRKDKRRVSLYRPQRWDGFTRSPIRTRSYCSQIGTKVRPRDDDDEEDTPPSPSVDRQNRLGRKAATSGTRSGNRRGQGGSGGGRQGGPIQQRIQDEPYCTHQCLLGVVSGGPIDQACPNAGRHGSRHINQVDFLHSLRAQLAEDRGPDAESTPLYLSGSVGSLFKLRLSAHGYTLVAKGVETGHLERLSHEKDVYDQLQHLQGNHVPVCLGLIHLVLPYYYDGGQFKHFLLLSWAGQPLSRCIDGLDKTRAIDLATKAYAELHRLQVLHIDAEPRNILYDAISGTLMVVDFERAELRGRQPLGLISPNGQGRKRKRGWMAQKQGKDDFTEELQSVVERVSMRFGDALPGGSRPLEAVVVLEQVLTIRNEALAEDHPDRLASQ
ncbi:hypothetical protein C7999DRAFT_36041 [Corynascus novoguineensis]|uniref:Protein kinase domain-containing protein n=1 Tax=Corynascus novoguineensis TaxID=1126955 RepID=A0AAN7CMS3_9PEZI|nr:hypothetical protein C7999DRAFT_36041 [Corynascus novoguineensis]